MDMCAHNTQWRVFILKMHSLTTKSRRHDIRAIVYFIPPLVLPQGQKL